MGVYLLGFIQFPSKMFKLWQFENLSMGNFLAGRAGRRKNGWIVTKRSSCKRLRKMDPYTKFQLLVGRSVGPVCTNGFS